ncbi:MAG: amidase [Gammaproteobacteria bacterium]|nr:amidase [Gammaproteobacteria bacterium]
MSELAFLSATAIAARIRNRELGCEEVLRHYLDRVDRHNGALNALVVDVREQALEEARAADRAVAAGDDLGPLHGVPMTLKESYNLAGTPTTWGNPGWKDNVAREDAESVKKLKQAGVVIFGKTNVPLMLADFQSYNDIYGTTNNPYDHARGPGGSSGGSAAALAAGLTGIETGSDIGGSIRNPAHYCGVFGHKPTWNLLWIRGHSPPGDMRSKPDISVIGPLARSAEDLETAVRAMAGPDEIMARGYRLDLPALNGRTLKDLRVAVWADDEGVPVNTDVRERVEKVAAAFRDGGAAVDGEARPKFDPASGHETYSVLLQATMAARMPDAEYETLREHVARLDPNDDSAAARVFRAQVASFKMWKQNDELRSQLRWRWHEFFKEFDLLLMPIMSTAAFRHDHRPMGQRTITVNGASQPYFDQVFWAGLASASYLPSTVIPTGLNDAGLPIGVQIVGPEYGDLVTIGAARMLEAAGFRFTPPPQYVD